MLTIEALAAVRTAELEGFRLDEALALEGIERDEWDRDAAEWDELLTDAGFPESVLEAALDDAVARARERYGRVVEPLESDLAAWVRFHAWLLAHPMPDRALRRAGLTQRDLGRLVKLWTVRCGADLSVEQQRRELSASLAKAPPKIPPEVTTRPRQPAPRAASAPGAAAIDLDRARELLTSSPSPPDPDGGHRAGPGTHEPRLGASDDSDDELESALDDDAPNEPAPSALPPLVVALPRIDDLARAAQPVRPDGPSAELPVARAPMGAASEPAPPGEAVGRPLSTPPPAAIPSTPPPAPAPAAIRSTPPPAPAAPLARAPMDPVRSPWAAQSRQPSSPPPVDAAAGLARPATALRSGSEPAPRRPSERPPMAAGVLPAFPLDPALGDQPVSMNMTIGPTDEPRGPALPFGRAAADGPANPARAEDGPKRIVVPAFDEAKVDFGSTLPDSFVLADMPWSKGPAALPFAPKAKRKGLPFVERDAKPPPPAATSPDGPALGIKGGTIMAMPAMSGDDAIPFDSPGAAGGANVVRRVAPSDRPVAAAKPTSPAEPTPSRSTEPSLTVGQFAQLLEELAAADKAPAAQAAREIVLTRHGFTEATFDELSSRWRKSAEKEPALFQELARARESYRRGRAGSR